MPLSWLSPDHDESIDPSHRRGRGPSPSCRHGPVRTTVMASIKLLIMEPPVVDLAMGSHHSAWFYALVDLLQINLPFPQPLEPCGWQATLIDFYINVFAISLCEAEDVKSNIIQATFIGSLGLGCTQGVIFDISSHLDLLVDMLRKRSLFDVTLLVILNHSIQIVSEIK
ncbi:hypothetical protein PR202_gb27777 [Eleusine coracana subsp. coracana]|uniref:Uncharacterized protein n=1 Tax=Eleusine coracana subsp. coracana TaxID=191504 RepID=A0AAV5FW64_ELECO|nr:hypothetical protein PR202_gb27777 [Eleusine coracana subsp. coracana]